jgi:uncharacterized protein
MPAAPVTSTDAEFEALAQVCSRLGGFAEHLSFEWVDGYLSALAAGPRPIPVGEWLPAMCGDVFERVFADPDDVAQATAALLARCNVLARQLDAEALDADPDRLRLAPMLVDDGAEARAEMLARGLSEAEVDALAPPGMLWAEGFLAACRAFAADWLAPDLAAPLALERDRLLAGVLALRLEGEALAAYLAELHPGKTFTRDELIDEACFCVQDLRLFWVDHAPTHRPLRRTPRPGRNDPCPCGSGRKFKKCCGVSQP